MARYRLLELRKEYGKTQKELADALGVTQGFLSSVEKGRNAFPNDRVEDLRKFFPDANLEDYEIRNEGYAVATHSMGSNNRYSEIKINDLDSLKQLTSALERISGENDKIISEYDRLRADVIKLTEQLDAERQRYEQAREREFELKEEILRLKELLLTNGISFN